ncbi:alpha-L-fucosidase 2 [Kribbella aluminosa]|uniref:Alpha-L-fucosidase 2 n=1 Tax=Kribbella aluminosa TaxID=416017 RepID=A0ABS4UWY1_9ACTN|nr:RICIN domain-containing protein [Kribbella aluminosa]MBP2356051.1 alpha-L-fucosidase 2 [Kribbella aluminosa]
MGYPAEGSSRPNHEERGNHIARRRVLQAAGLTGLATFALPVFEAHAAVDRPADCQLVPDEEALRLWYRTPAEESIIIEEGLPIGNGRLGGLIGGTPADTALFLTDASLWSGGRNTTLDGAGQFPYDRSTFGTFQLLAKARVLLPDHTPDVVTDYQRSLDLSNGLVVTTYRVGEVAYRQECFSSHSDDVVVVRITQSGGGSLTGSVAVEGTRGEVAVVDRSASTTSITDALDNGLRYAAVAGVSTDGGTVGTGSSTVTFTGASEVLVVISGGTNYRPDASIDYRDTRVDPGTVARQKLRTALLEPRLVETHVADYQRQFGSFSLHLGDSTAQQRAQDTAARLASRGAPGAAPDPEFDVLYLQLARYLTITGSRAGLPTNLQGLWLDTNEPDWMSDYHTDINIQMNYWPTHRFGLAEHAEPLLDYCLAQLPQWSKQTLELFNDPRNRFRNTSGRVAGWTVAFSTNVHGGNGWWWHPAGGAWLCLELWQHYEYTLDKRFLARLMPLLRGTVEFWESRLIERTVGEGSDQRTALLADKAWSPEHGPQDGIGNTYDQELVHAVLGCFVEASKLLNRDVELAGRAQLMRERLYLPEVSPKTGWLEEWRSPDNLGDAQHRHLSPLIGWYPGDRIRLDNQPAAYIAGIRNLLEARGFDSYGWACAWRAACWARLKDSNRAYKTISNVLRPAHGHLGGTGINLFDLYRTNRYIFQIDANFGIPAAMLEMLVHAKPGVVDLMPAVPAAWNDGSVRGMGVRGGFTLDMTWKAGAPISVTLHSVGGTATELRVGDWKRSVHVRPGGSVTLQPQGVPYPPPPPPPEPAPASVIKNVHSGLVIDVSGGGSNPGAAIDQWPDVGSTNQRWQQVQTNNGFVMLQCVRSGQVIDVPNAATAEGTDVVQWTTSGAPNQQWMIENTGSGQMRIVSRITDKVLGIAGQSAQAGAAVEIQADTGHPSQRWTIVQE